jgi:glutamate dehydrogenase
MSSTSQILAEIKQKMNNSLRKHPQKNLLENLVDPLYQKAAPDLLKELGVESLLALTLNAFQTLQKCEDSEIKVRVFNPQLQVDGWESPHSVLEVLLKDRPFIVDSLRNLLRREGYELKHLLHPILKIERSAQGELKGLGKGRLEAYELYFINQCDESKLQSLSTKANRVLKEVALATQDYEKMRDQLKQSIQYTQNFEKEGLLEVDKELLSEYIQFLRWLDDNHFVFLGYREYDLLENEGKRVLQVTKESGLGILSDDSQSSYKEAIPLENLPKELQKRIESGPFFMVSKTNRESLVHRSARLDYIGIKKLNEKQEVVGEYRFLGLFTSKALSSTPNTIPILHLKMKRLLELDGEVEGSYDYKEMISVFNTIPLGDLFWLSVEEIHQEIRRILELSQERTLRLSMRPDPLFRGIAVTVTMPRERFNAEVRQRVQETLQERLQASHVDYHLAMSEEDQKVRFHFFFSTNKAVDTVNLSALEQELSEITRSWEEVLADKLIKSVGEREGSRLASRYAKAFDKRYRASISFTTALKDISNFEILGKSAYLVELMNPIDDYHGEAATDIRIYHQDRPLILSMILPLLENLGFKVLEQISYVITEDGTNRGLDIFRIQNQKGELLDVREHGDRLKSALSSLLLGEVENDRLNTLVLEAGLDVRQIALLRAYRMYYAQINPETSIRFITDTLIQYPVPSRLIFQTFEAKFHPKTHDLTRYQELQERFFDSLNTVPSLSADRTLRGMMNLIDSSVRSNYYQSKKHISFKIDSNQVSIMPQPRPFREIAVSHPDVEGIHLRGGMVARGGIRWSDRPDDFRTEVLGLMKTQMTKNAVIVPVGSKGGFVLKHAPSDRNALRDYVRQQYITFISGLLDITDNIVKGEVQHPEHCVLYDKEDPYLVVAADKGTATFSDTANGVAQEYQFWLGDAFASGGSNGYDHKKEAITARGAWVCVERHFREMGHNIQEKTFSAIGIGDMSGDVFGNGMIYSKNTRLLAAFNHAHIFLDPCPDPLVSYEERKRLFELPRSTWEDYNPKLISEGGGVFSRFDKSIRLSTPVQEMLGLPKDLLSGFDLIKAILRMPVDLLWNGGIGTYVKSSSERHDDVGDTSNNAVRINANEVRAKIVGEGGNLGFTQLARIEYALNGGRLNTDAIDNSGGVDMSDHEVNIKILFQPIVQKGSLHLDGRNKLLREMTDDVSKLVLQDNYNQSLALSLSERRSLEDLELFQNLQEYLVQTAGLKDRVEFLPNHRNYQERRDQKKGLTRPELAILLAYSKMGVYKGILEHNLEDASSLQPYLLQYFPRLLQQKYSEEIQQHLLKKEILATQFTNKVVDLLGPTFVYRMIRNTGASIFEVTRSALISMGILDVEDFTSRLFSLDYKVNAVHQYEALERFACSIERIVPILLSLKYNVNELLNRYSSKVQELRSFLPDYLYQSEHQKYEMIRQSFIQYGFPENLARHIGFLTYAPGAIAIAEISHLTQTSLQEVLKLHYDIAERFSLGGIFDTLDKIQVSDKWQRISMSGIITDLYRTHRLLTQQCIKKRHTLKDLLANAPQEVAHFDHVLKEIREGDFTISASGVLMRLLARLLEN